MRRALVSSILAALLAAGCGGGAEPASDKKENAMMQEVDLAAIGRELGLALPPSCRVLGYSAEAGIDEAWRLKLGCSPAETSRLLAEPPLQGLELLDSERYLLGPDEDWWNPSDPESLPTGQIELSGARFLNIGVADSGAERTLYLMWHTT